MKKFIKSTAVFIAALLLLSCVSIAARTNNYVLGDVVLFGEYPQTLVTDENTVNELNAMNAVFSDDNGCFSYADIQLSGSRYRGIKYSVYRPGSITDTPSVSEGGQAMFTNGYRINTVYWFRYEPLRWRVLDAEKGLVLCESIVDSMPVTDSVYVKDGVSYTDSSCQYFANNYEKSNIREWLNGSFLNTVFTDNEISAVKTTDIDNKARNKKSSVYDSVSTQDKLFLLSFDESVNPDYGFSRSERADYTRYAWPTDYAKAMGIYVVIEPKKACNGCSPWRLRTPGSDSGTACCVSRDGLSFDYNEVVSTDRGVRPAMTVDLGAVENAGYNAICKHACHQDGIVGFFWRIVNLFNKMLKINKTCVCGKEHW